MTRLGAFGVVLGMLLVLVAQAAWAGGAEEYKAGQAALSGGDYKKAVGHFKAAVAAGDLAGPAQAEACFGLGRALEESDEMFEALPAFQKALSLDRGNEKYQQAVFRVQRAVRQVR